VRCGAEHDRDINQDINQDIKAAVNILRVGASTLTRRRGKTGFSRLSLSILHSHDFGRGIMSNDILRSGQKK
jgi:hypothetical protein